MIKRSILFIFHLLLCIITVDGYCQTSNPVRQTIPIKEAVFKHPDTLSFTGYLHRYFSLNKEFERKRLDTICRKSFGFVKFRISAQKKVIDFICSPTMPFMLVRVMEEMIRSSETYWIPRQVNGSVSVSQYYLLPIYYQLGNGDCADIVFEDEMAIYRGREYEKRMQTEMLGDFFYMLQFDPKEIRKSSATLKHIKDGDALDCILLQPILINGGF